VLTTAHKNGTLDAADLASAIASMVTLNRGAAEARSTPSSTRDGHHGFGLAGHAYEMAERSSVALRIRASLVRFFLALVDMRDGSASVARAKHVVLR